MQYFGGKFRIRHKVAAILNQLPGDIYLEPFCGSCWVGELVTKPHKIFSDANYYLIAMWNALKHGWVPPTIISEEEYKLIRYGNYPPELKGFVGFGSSFGGKFWGGYARNALGKNYGAIAYRQCMKRIMNLGEGSFIHCRYSKMFQKLLKIQSIATVYCDPPYENTTKYYGLPDFDHVKFWANVRVVSSKHYVLTSSYVAPDDFHVVTSIQTETAMHGENKSRQENLYGIGKVVDDFDWER
jgi:DNA adenine methylase